MCIICRDLILDKMTWKQAARNLIEMKEEVDPEHKKEVRELIKKKFHERNKKK